jgi:hypothetical protein
MASRPFHLHDPYFWTLVFLLQWALDWTPADQNKLQEPRL